MAAMASDEEPCYSNSPLEYSMGGTAYISTQTTEEPERKQTPEIRNQGTGNQQILNAVSDSTQTINQNGSIDQEASTQESSNRTANKTQNAEKSVVDREEQTTGNQVETVENEQTDDQAQVPGSSNVKDYSWTKTNK